MLWESLIVYTFNVLPFTSPHIVIVEDSTLSVNEGQSVTFAVKLVNTSDQAVLVDYEIDQVQPGAGSAFISGMGQVKWEPMESGQQSVTLTTVDNTVDEFNRSFSLLIKNPLNAELICHSDIEILILDNNINLNLLPGWNLVSIPYMPVESDIAKLFSLQPGDFIWQWDTEKKLFIISEEFENQAGYWIYCQGDKILIENN